MNKYIFIYDVEGSELYYRRDDIVSVSIDAGEGKHRDQHMITIRMRYTTLVSVIVIYVNDEEYSEFRNQLYDGMERTLE